MTRAGGLGRVLWGDPPWGATPDQLGYWCSLALTDCPEIIDLLRDVAAGQVRTGVVHTLCRELGDRDGDEAIVTITPSILTGGLRWLGLAQLADDLDRRLNRETR